MAGSGRQRIRVKKDEPSQTDDLPQPLGAEAVVDLVIGQDAAPLYYGTSPLPFWPCRLVAAIAQASDQTENLKRCSWHHQTATPKVLASHKLSVNDGGYDHLLNRFDADVFAVLVARARQDAQNATEELSPEGFLLLTEVASDLRLDQNDAAYAKVSESIMRLVGLSVDATSLVCSATGRRQHCRIQDEDTKRQTTMFCLLSSYETPSDEDFQNSAVRITWNYNVYQAITARPPEPDNARSGD